MTVENSMMPIHRAIRAGNLSEVMRLVSEDRSLLLIWTPFGTWLHDAASEGQLEIVRWLVAQGLDVNAYNDAHESPPVTVAAARGHADVVRFLIESGARLDTTDSVRNPLLATVVGSGSDSNVEVARVLLDGGIDTNVRYSNLKNMDAFEFAKEWGRLDIVELLESKLRPGQ